MGLLEQMLKKKYGSEPTLDQAFADSRRYDFMEIWKRSKGIVNEDEMIENILARVLARDDVKLMIKEDAIRKQSPPSQEQVERETLAEVKEFHKENQEQSQESITEPITNTRDWFRRKRQSESE